MNARSPDKESERLAALHDHRILDTAPQAEFDDLVRLAALVCGVPIAAVSLIDEHRQWFKAITGLDIAETSRDVAFCAHAILQTDIFVVPDAQADDRFADNPLVTGDPGIRFYAGVSLITEDGHALGSLCVIDRTPRTLTPEQEAMLGLLARQAASQLRAARRMAERESLVADKERMAAIVETCEDAIYGKALDGRVTSWNAGAERLYGYAADEVIGRHVCLLIPPDRRDELAHTVDAVCRGERAAPLQTTHVTKSGTYVDVCLRVSPITGPGGRVVGASMIARDVTERKRTAATLAAEREFTRAMLESLQEGIVACDADGTLTLFNRATREFHGLPPQPLPPEQWADHFDLYEKDGVTPMRTRDIPLFRALQGENVRDAEMVIAPRFGPTRTLLAGGQAIYDAHGAKLGAVVAMHDVTDRRMAERESARLAAIVASAEEAIAATTLDGTVISWNAGAARLYGYGASEVIGRHVSCLVPEGEGHPLPSVVTRLLRGEVVEPLEVARTRRDGTRFHAALSFSPIHDSSGDIVGVSCITRDVTARKAAEDALAQSHAALAESNARLLESEQRLRRLTDAAFEGIAVTQDGMITDASQTFADLFGYGHPAEVIGRAGVTLAASQSRERVAGKIARCDEEPYEATMLRRDGTTFEAELRGRGIQLGGRPARVTAVRDVTERKAMEEALRESNHALQQSQAFIQAVADNSTSMIYVFDLGTMSNVYTNRDLGEFWGYTPEQIQAMGDGLVAHVVHPDDMAHMMGHFADFAHVPDGRVVEFETRCRHADGGWRWLWVREVVFNRNHDGTARQIMGTAQDVTERRALEEEKRRGFQALGESEARLAEAQRIARVGSWEYDLTDGKITWSDELFRLFGLDPTGGVPGYEDAVALYHPEDAPGLDALVARAAQEGVGYALDLRGGLGLFGGGPPRWYHTTGEAVRDATGRVARLSGTLADITDRKRMEEALREQAEQLRRSETGLRALLEGAPVILYAADADGTVTMSQGAGLAALGLAPGEVVGTSIYQFSGGDAEIEENTRRALAGEAVSYDARAYGLSLHTELRPQRDATGVVTGIIGVCLDMTERAMAEERFRVLFEQSSDAHLLCGQGGIIDCNNATLAMMRCADKAQLLGTHPGVFSPEFQPDGRQSQSAGLGMDTLARERGFHRFEWTHRKLDGEEFPTEVTLTPVTLATGPAILAVLHDLTERKRAEETARDHAIVLEFQNQQLERANAELAALATTDGLTGLKNHRAFQERLAEEVARAERYGTPLSLILLDVDHFKQFNDSHGHPAGDAVLRSVAQALQRCARDTDVVARYGGEEFVLVLPQTDMDGASAFAERLRSAVEGHPWPLRAVTASLGVSTLRRADAGGGDAIARADQALYISKAAGRNRVTCSPGMAAAAETALSRSAA